jgi:hypothetical protein
MEFSRILVALAVALWSVVIGLSIVAFGQILLAIREIALNTRKEGAVHHQGHYAVLLVMAKVNNVLGWIVLVAGLAAAVYVAVAGVPIFTGLTPAAVVQTGYLRP